MKKCFALVALATLFTIGCGHYSFDNSSLSPEPKSDIFEFWGGQVASSDPLGEVTGKWGRGDYTYLAQTVNDENGKLDSYRIEICKVRVMNGSEKGCAVGQAFDSPGAFAQALEKDLKAK